VIKAVFKRGCGSGKKILGFEISGHSGYADSGSDIVCAAVTSAVQLAANAATETVGINAEVEVGENIVSLRLPEEIGDSQKEYAAEAIFEALLLHLETLSEQYRGTIQIKVMEVK